MRFQPSGVDPKRDARGEVIAAIAIFLLAAGNVILTAAEGRTGVGTWISLAISLVLVGRIWTRFPAEWKRWRSFDQTPPGR